MGGYPVNKIPATAIMRLCEGMGEDMETFRKALLVEDRVWSLLLEQESRKQPDGAGVEATS